MKLIHTLVVAASTTAVSTALAEPLSAAQEVARGSLYGIGQGLAAAVVIGQRPIRVVRLRAKSEITNAERRYFVARGLRVVVLKFAGNDFMVPASVEITNPSTLRLVNHDFPGLTRAALIANYGPPDAQSANALHYNGLAEICSDSIDIGLKDEKAISIKWNFCSD